MEPKPHTFLVGLFVLGLTLAGTAFVLWFSDIDFKQEKNLYTILFLGSVTGLRENQDVFYMGTPIGRVKKISVYKEDVKRVRVLVSIKSPLFIREHSVATIEAQGLTGNAFIQIKGSTQDSPILKAKPGQKFPIIKSEHSNMELLFSEVPRLLKDLSLAANQLRDFFNEDMIQDTRRTLRNIHKITTDLSEGTHSLTQMVGGFKNASDSLSTFIHDNKLAIQDFTQEGLPEVTQLVKQLKKSATLFNSMIQQLEESPMTFLAKNPQQGVSLP